MEGHGPEMPSSRATGGAGNQSQGGSATDRSGDVGHPVEAREQEEGHAHDLREGGLGGRGDGHRNHGEIDSPCHGSHLCCEQGAWPRPCGHGEALGVDVHGGAHRVSRLCQMGDQDGGRGRSPLPPSASRQLVEDHGEDTRGVTKANYPSPPTIGTRGAKDQVSTQGVWEPINKFRGLGAHEADTGDGGNYGRTGGGAARRCGIHEGGAPPQERDRVQRVDERLLSRERDEGGEVDPEEDESRAPEVLQELTPNLERYLGKETERLVSESFQALVQDQRTVLIEVACSPTSLLTSQMQQTVGYEEAALRCAHWNGFDLETRSGVEGVINLIRRKRPLHVWMSPECGPYSPMQAINQRTEQQRQDLEQKRRRALKQYMGCSAIWQYCAQEGIHVSWEWAERCQGWRLPFMQKLSKRYVPYYSTTHGCQVNLRDPASSKLVHKGWKVMTTHARLSDLLGLPCRCGPGYQHARCEGRVAGQSAFYTPEFVKRVCLGITQELTPHMANRELGGQTCLLASFGTGATCVCSDLRHHGSDHTCGKCVSHLMVEHGLEPERERKDELGDDNSREAETRHDDIEISRERESADEWGLVGHFTHPHLSDEEIRKKLYMLHAATGHTSTRNLVQALQRRGASPRVITLAQQFHCPICHEQHKVHSKHVSSLEVLPPKFATICADGGKWTHPVTGEECEFACVIDEGSRFRTARILCKGKRQTMSAAQFLDYLKEGWIQYFGQPQTLRLDPSGAFRSREVERFCEERDILLDVIPGEAHWQLGTCEAAIGGLKAVMQKLIEADGAQTAEDVLAEAVRVFNNRELVRGFSPLQHVLGRAPDETGRFISGVTERGMEPIMETVTDEMERSTKLRMEAEKALSEWQATQRIRRAMNSRPQRPADYRPGDLVYFWRRQVAGQSMGKNGAFCGPARILAMETKSDGNGSSRPGRGIWCVKGTTTLEVHGRAAETSLVPGNLVGASHD